MTKNKVDSSLSDVVVVDNFPVQRELSQLLKRIDNKSKWVVVCANNALEFVKKNDGYTDEYKPLYKIVSKEFDRVAMSAKSIWIATCPDVRGDYLAVKFNEHIKKDLKLNCSVYRMRLSHISEESVLNSIINKQNIFIDQLVRLKHEAYNVLEHAISNELSKLFKEKFPFSFSINLHTGILLDFIDSCSGTHKIRRKSFYSALTLYKGEIVTNSSPVKCKLVSEKKIKKVTTLESLYYGLSGFVSWFGFASNLNEAYAKGCITYPTSDTANKTPKSIQLKNTKSSKKNWGITFIKKDDSLPDTAKYIVSESRFRKTRMLREYEYSQKEPFFIHKLALAGKSDYVSGDWKDCGTAIDVGVSQLEVLYYLRNLGFSYKLIPWITYSLVKNGLVVYTTDATITLTALGKFVLLLLRDNVPILLKRKYIINTLGGIDDLKFEDELEYYEFMQQRIDKVKVLTDAAYENMVVPKCSAKCSCGKRYTLTINNNSVFATCSNNKCVNAGKVFPINIKDGIVEVKNDKLGKSKRLLKHCSKVNGKKSTD